jgi:UDP-galactopyranose mutase
MDLELVGAVAEARPDWHWVMIGPVAKIAASDLPRRENIHYLGMKSYDELPRYIAGWDVAVLPFARNEATRFISPTKTPEYLAAGRPVVSTSIKDVVSPYGELGLVHIADQADEFIAAVERAMHEDSRERLRKVDALLSQGSWSHTWGRMTELMDDVIQQPSRVAAARATFEVPKRLSIPGTL